MQALIDFFKGLGKIIFGFFYWIDETIYELLYVKETFDSFSARIPDLFSWLPSACVSLISIAFIFVILYKLLGREG